MKKLLLPFFIVRLLWTATPTLFILSVLSFPYYSLVFSFLFASYVLGMAFFSLRAHFFPLSSPPSTIDIDSPTLFSDSSYEVETTPGALTREITKWEKIRSFQPTHRDVLYNLSLLYTALHQPEKAQQYKLQAEQVDPNHPLFDQ